MVEAPSAPKWSVEARRPGESRRQVSIFVVIRQPRKRDQRTLGKRGRGRRTRNDNGRRGVGVGIRIWTSVIIKRFYGRNVIVRERSPVLRTVAGGGGHRRARDRRMLQTECMPDFMGGDVLDVNASRTTGRASEELEPGIPENDVRIHQRPIVEPRV